jgi:hypothetical protein
VPAKGLFPTVISFVTVFQADDGLKNAQSGVIRTSTELQSILPRQSSYLADKVNFEKEQLIFVALGERTVGMFEAQINSVLYLTDRGNGLPALTEVSYRETTTRGAVVDSYMKQAVYPMHVIKLRKLDGQTTFNKN